MRDKSSGLVKPLRKLVWAAKWVALLLALWSGLSALAAPPLKLPGRSPGSAEPWGAFLGRAAHDAIGLQYRAQYPTHTVFLNRSTLLAIMSKGKLGDPERLSEFVKALSPDIVDVSRLVLFEIKPDHVEGRALALVESRQYLTALNEAVDPGKKLTGGTGFEGSLFVEFEGGGALWQLSWHTPEAGATLYRWSYRREKPGATRKERVAQKEESVPVEEIVKKGAVAEQAIRAAYGVGEWPDEFQGQVHLPVDCQ